MEFSIVHFYGKQIARCGYCKGSNCSVSDGMHAYNMMPQDYQELIDRGWRRSGHYCYKPNNRATCCPCYTIKCDALDFKLTKSHKKVLKRMNRFLRDGRREKSEEQPAAAGSKSEVLADENGDAGGASGGINDEPKEPEGPLPAVNFSAVAAANPKRFAEAAASNDATRVATRGDNDDDQANSSLAGSLDSANKSLDVSKPPCKKAKQMRLERRQAKLAARGVSAGAQAEPAAAAPATKAQADKTLADFLSEPQAATDKHKLKIILVPTTRLSVTDVAYNLYRKYQLLVHNDNPQRLSAKSLQRFLYKSPLQLKLLPVKSKQFQGTLPHSFALYAKYQTHIHQDPPLNVAEYLDFLQRSPLQHTRPHDGPAMGFGSFHQQYWLDEQLIAVAVIDILPYCVSSVYFFYDPDYSFLSLGTYGSLRELQFVRELAQKLPALQYYYMGFYIHSCPKMRYKGKLTPSHLLCPETYTWQPLTDAARGKLDAQKYQRLNEDASACDADNFATTHLDAVQLLVTNRIITYRQFIQSSHVKCIDNMLDIVRSRIYKEITGEDDERDTVLNYGKLVGRSCAHRMLYLKCDES